MSLEVKDAVGLTKALKTTLAGGEHTPHHLVDGTVAVTDNGGSLTVDGTVELGATSLSALENIQVTFPSTQNVSVQNASLAVTGTFWQATQPVSGTFWQATQPVSGTFWQATQPVSGPLTDTELRATPVPVSGTFWQATQPVSGTVTANAGTNLNTSALALESTATSIKTAVETLDNAISGNEMQVDIVSSAAIPVTDNGGTLTVDGTVTAAQATAANLNATVVQSTATNLRTQAESYQGGTAVGSGNPLQVTLANTGANTTALRVEPKNGAVTRTTGDTDTANTSKEALASSSSRRYLLIQNISDTDMYFNFGATATTDNMLITKNGGGIVFESGYVPTDAVNVICSGADKKYFILSA